MSNHFEDELELLMLHNPNGGKPQKIGKTVFVFPESLERRKSFDLSQVAEDNSIRFHLGYCPHGSKMVVGEKRALILVKTLQRCLGITCDEELDAKMLKHVMDTYPQGEIREA